MKGLPLLVGLVLFLLPATPTNAYQWYHVTLDSVDHPVYEIQFGGGEAFAGTAVGVFRGYGLPGFWVGMNLEYPGLGAYSILCLEHRGWTKHAINESPIQGATGVGLGDLNQSGRPDVVVGALPASNRVVWYENPHPPPVYWSAHSVDSLALGAREVSISDIDGDTDLDVAVALRDENKIVWYENSFVSPDEQWPVHEVGVLGGPRGVFVADINADDRPDIVAGGMNENTVMWFEAPPDPSDAWIPHCVDDDLETVKGVFAINIDCDADLDIVAAGREAGDVVWYEQVSLNPEVWDKHFIDVNLPGAVSVWCGDLVGGGDPEVAVTAKYAGWVVVYESEGPGGVGPWLRTVVDSALAEACPLSAGDIDGDGRTDLVAAGKSAGVVAWYKTPSGAGRAWQKTVVDNAAGHSMGITAGDVDRDGDVDIVATANDEGQVMWYENRLLDLYCGFSDGTGLCESDGVYRWYEDLWEWVPSYWCPRPFFVEEHPLAPGTFFCGNHLGLFVSTDLVDWYEVGEWILPDTVQCIWFHPSDPGVILAGTHAGMYRTPDAGMHWDPVLDIPTLPVMDIETGVSPLGPPTTWVFASVGDGSFSDGIFRSGDFGLSWVRINWLFRPTDLVQDNTWEDPATVVMFTGTMMNGIYRVDLNGTIVDSLNIGLPTRTVYRMRYDPLIDCPAIFGCTEDGLYECMLLEDTSVDLEPAPVTRGPCLARPNPWSEGVVFSLKDVGRATVDLRIFDPTGRAVWTSRSAPSHDGTWSVHWDGTNARGQTLPPGVYFYRLEAEGRTYVGKVVRVK